MTDQLRCIRCGQSHPISDYVPRQTGKIGYYRTCNHCRASRRTELNAERNAALADQCLALLREHGPLTTTQLRDALPRQTIGTIAAAMNMAVTENRCFREVLKEAGAPRLWSVPERRERCATPINPLNPDQQRAVLADLDRWHSALTKRNAQRRAVLNTMRARA